MPQSDASALFDEYGRCIPGPLLAPAHVRSRRYFRCREIVADPAEVYRRIRTHLAPELKTSSEAFATAVEGIRQALADDPATRAILAGTALPFLLPRLPAADIGETLDARFLPAVASAYREAQPDYAFVDHYPAGTAGRLSPLPGSRHDRLLAAVAERELCGIYFPCLSEYSLPAALERLTSLPERFLLAGGFDTAAALVGTPDALLREDGYPPLLWLSALQAEKDGIGYHFEAYGYNLTFNRRPHLGQAAEYWWHGLTVLAA